MIPLPLRVIPTEAEESLSQFLCTVIPEFPTGNIRDPVMKVTVRKDIKLLVKD